MSSGEQNIALVKGLYAAFARRDINLILDMISPDIVWEEPSNPFNPSAGRHEGKTGFLDWLTIGRECEEILTLETRKFLADTGIVVVVGYTECLAKTTGKSYKTDFVHLIVLEDGKIRRFQEFFDTYAAAEAFRKRD